MWRFPTETGIREANKAAEWASACIRVRPHERQPVAAAAEEAELTGGAPPTPASRNVPAVPCLEIQPHASDAAISQRTDHTLYSTWPGSACSGGAHTRARTHAYTSRLRNRGAVRLRMLLRIQTLKITDYKTDTTKLVIKDTHAVSRCRLAVDETVILLTVSLHRY